MGLASKLIEKGVSTRTAVEKSIDAVERKPKNGKGRRKKIAKKRKTDPLKDLIVVELKLMIARGQMKSAMDPFQSLGAMRQTISSAVQNPGMEVKFTEKDYEKRTFFYSALFNAFLKKGLIDAGLSTYPNIELKNGTLVSFHGE